VQHIFWGLVCVCVTSLWLMAGETRFRLLSITAVFVSKGCGAKTMHVEKIIYTQKLSVISLHLPKQKKIAPFWGVYWVQTSKKWAVVVFSFWKSIAPVPETGRIWKSQKWLRHVSKHPALFQVRKLRRKNFEHCEVSSKKIKRKKLQHIL